MIASQRWMLVSLCGTGVLLGVLPMVWCPFVRSFTSKKPLLSTGAKEVSSVLLQLKSIVECVNIFLIILVIGEKYMDLIKEYLNNIEGMKLSYGDYEDRKKV